jgi:hypothetical protein
MRGVQGFVARPFGDARAVVLRTSDRAMQGLYECIGHSAAVIGLNTSAELEAAILGKPVYTVLAEDADADGQRSTLHFHYLLEQEGGFVRVASTLAEHVAQIERELATPSDAETIRRFVGQFLRPLGAERPVSPLLAEAIERTFDIARVARTPPGQPSPSRAADAVPEEARDLAARGERPASFDERAVPTDWPPSSGGPTRPVMTIAFRPKPSPQSPANAVLNNTVRKPAPATVRMYVPDPTSGDRYLIARTV